MKPAFTVLTTLLNDHAAALTFMGYQLELHYDEEEVLIDFKNTREIPARYIFPNQVNAYEFNTMLKQFERWLTTVSEKSQILMKLSEAELRILGYELPKN